MADTSLRRSSMLMTFGSMASRILGVLRTALITGLIGLSFAADAFQTANTLPNVIFTLAAGGVLNAVLVPQLVQAAKQADGGKEFTDRLLTVAILGLGVLTVVVTVAAPWLIRLMSRELEEARPEVFDLTVAFAYFFLPQVFFYGLYALLGNVLAARGRFTAYAWAPFVANVVAIIGYLGFMFSLPGHRVTGTWTPSMIAWFAGTTTLSVVAQALFLIVPLRRSGFRFHPRFGVHGTGLGKVSRIAAWAFLGIAVSQIPYFVSTRVLNRATAHAEGFVPGVGVTNNAYMIFMLPHAFVTVSIITALYPRISGWAAEKRTDLLKRDYRRATVMPIVANVPAMALMILLALPIVSLLNPGVRSAAELSATAKVLSIMVMAIVPFGLDLLNYRIFFALDDPKTPLLTNTVWALLGIGVTMASMAFAPQYAAYVYASSIVVSNVASWLIGTLLLRRRVGYLGMAQVTRTVVRVSVATIVALLAGSAMNLFARPLASWLLEATQGLGSWLSRPLAYGTQIGVVSGVFVLVYFLGARAMRVHEIEELADLVLGRVTERHRPRHRSMD